MILAYFRPATLAASSERAPVTTILPLAKINAVVLGSRILIITAAKRLGLYSAFRARMAMSLRLSAVSKLTVATMFCSCGGGRPDVTDVCVTPSMASSVGFRVGEMEYNGYEKPAEDAMEGVTQTSVTSGLPPPQLQNIVATVNLDTALNLKDIAMRARNAEYNPKRFAAVIMRIRDPKTTALIFASGKMVVTGARSEDAARVAGRKYARIIQKLGFAPKYKDFKIQNIVASTDVRFPIRLESLAFAHSQFSSYEPELFPGLIYRMVFPKVVLLIFVSGKIVLTGAKDRGEITTAFENIYPVLTEYRKIT
eukprot:TRINITY_DN2414_c0_g2_i1.p1 TRINITY_DN2414_c0_g2~~TRINITY_DN2414_c0_g2_i1.p1  ORF type:complete len:310 (+),score=57.93 TRINITY_DN2414_c0_g2_i1:550-1479(+)